ncbi:DNA primase [Natronospira proteinivora]|uniref:DNA primase n=1 Tax=Natronospira proteinivora TaxID=1807133 RepID=A0ABT1GAW4_9GAMM|nr:DNA primase [Natronospira proteinivora]MCP1728460.1 DNA primase [Natronospira proteinivora]
MARIPQQFIDDLLDRVDIVDLIDSRVPLKKKGREFAACCPFHSEKTPSFYVSPEKQFYHCFGCGAHGTAISFLMEFEHQDFREAVKELADRSGLEVPDDGPSHRPDPDGALRDALDHADRYFQTQLRQSDSAKQYLKGRGLSGKTAADFGLGFAPDQWSGLMDSARDQGQRDALLKTGMFIKSDKGRIYDRFRGRIMFPIRDNRGRTIAFGGRIIGNGKPKYLNSPEHPLFHKGHELYGLYEARTALRHIPRLLVVEGYMDVIALAEAGIRWATATLGTAATPDHLNKAFRVTREVVCCFDGDDAGRRAAWRALENALPTLRSGREMRFLFLPEGEDPDTMVRQEGAEAFTRRVESAMTLSRFLRQGLSEGLDLGSAEGRAGLVARARPLLSKVEDGVYRTLLSDELADAAGLDPVRWTAMLETSKPAPQAGTARGTSQAEAAPKPKGPRRTRAPSPKPRMTPVREAIALVLQHPRLAAHIPQTGEVAALDVKGAETLAALLEAGQNEPDITTATLLERWRDQPEHPHLERLAGSEIPGDQETLGRHLAEIIQRLTGPHAIEARLDALNRKAAETELNQAEKQEMRELHQARLKLEKQEG